VEGCGQGQLGANWGDGFVTEPSLVTPNSMNDPTGFFTAVVENDYKYGPALLFRNAFWHLQRYRPTRNSIQA
jgi:hypothetical protein